VDRLLKRKDEQQGKLASGECEVTEGGYVGEDGIWVFGEIEVCDQAPEQDGDGEADPGCGGPGDWPSEPGPDPEAVLAK
jgi:hypothetical protein